MKRMSVLLSLSVLCLFLVFSNESSAQTKSSKKASSRQSKAEGSTQESKPRKISGRLPRMYGKLKLSDEQRFRIYEIQAKYKVELDDLAKQILELKESLSEETEEVLTTAQKTLLEDLRSGNAGSGRSKLKSSKKNNREKSSSPRSEK